MHVASARSAAHGLDEIGGTLGVGNRRYVMLRRLAARDVQAICIEEISDGMHGVFLAALSSASSINYDQLGCG